MVSHEYGSKSKRPHHHVIIFGWCPEELKIQSYTKGGYPLFTSTELEKLWDKGFHSIGEANEKTAYYIAAYSLKGKEHKVTDKETGEIQTVSDSFDCSKNPAIGKRFFTENYKQMIDSGELLPRYYSKLLEKIDPYYYEIYENKRVENFRSLNPYERYSKYKVSEAKKALSDNEFRKTAPYDKKAQFTSNLLKSSIKEMNK